MCRKKISFILILMLIVVLPIFSEGTPDGAPEAVTQPTLHIDIVDVSMAVLKGPTGFGYVDLLGGDLDLGFGVTLNAEVLPSPNEAVARVVSGEVDFAALPANTAAVLYNKGVPIQLAAVTGEGMLYFLSNDPSKKHELTKQFIYDLAEEGEKIYVPAPGATPDLIVRYLLEAWGVDIDVRESVVDLSISSPAQLAQMLIAGKISYAVLPEPFATMAEMKQVTVMRSTDMQKLWEAETGNASYPMTALVVQQEFVEKHSRAFEHILEYVQGSLKFTVDEPHNAAQLIEQYGILSAALAEPSIPLCELVYIPAAAAQESFEEYLTIMAGLDPAVIGGTLPDEAFYAGN